MAEKKLTREAMKIIYYWLQTNDKWGNNVWQETAQEGILDILQNTWYWNEEKLTTEKLNHKMPLHLDDEGWTVWKLAAYGANWM